MKKIVLIFIVLYQLVSTKTNGQEFKKENSVSIINILDVKNFQELNTSICDTLFSFRTRPLLSGLTWDGLNLWYVDTSYIYKVSSTGLHIDSIPNPVVSGIFFKGGDLTFDGLNLWYADESTAQLFKINPSTGSVLQQYNLPSIGQLDPNGFGLAWDGVNIWHSQYNPFALYKLNPLNGNIIDSLSTTTGILGIEWVSGSLYGISNQQIFKINTSTGAFQDSTLWCIPFPLGLAWDGTSLWNVSGQDTVLGVPTGGQQKIYKLNSDLVSSMGEHSNFNNSLEVFPNPANEKLHIRGEQIKTIEIYDVLGEYIYGTTNFDYQKSNEVDLSHILEGIYFVKVKDGDIIYTKKVIFQ